MRGVDAQQVVSTFLGASAGGAGFALVFLGLVVSAYGALAGDVPRAVRKRLRRPVFAILGAFGASMACLTLAGLWMLWSSGPLLIAVVTAFFLQIAALIAAVIHTLKELLWG